MQHITTCLILRVCNACLFAVTLYMYIAAQMMATTEDNDHYLESPDAGVVDMCADIWYRHCGQFMQSVSSMRSSPHVFHMHVIVACIFTIVAVAVDDLIQNLLVFEFSATTWRNLFIQPFHRENFHEAIEVGLVGVCIGILLGGVFSSFVHEIGLYLWIVLDWIVWIIS